MSDLVAVDVDSPVDRKVVKVTVSGRLPRTIERNDYVFYGQRLHRVLQMLGYQGVFVGALLEDRCFEVELITPTSMVRSAEVVGAEVVTVVRRALVDLGCELASDEDFEIRLIRPPEVNVEQDVFPPSTDEGRLLRLLRATQEMEEAAAYVSPSQVASRVRDSLDRDSSYTQPTFAEDLNLAIDWDLAKLDADGLRLTDAGDSVLLSDD